MKALELIHILQKYMDIDFAPIKYGSSTRRTHDLANLTDDEICEIWTRVKGGIFKASNKWNGVVHISYMMTAKARDISSLWINIDDEFFEDETRKSRFLDLCKDVYTWGNMDHAYVAHRIEFIQKNRFGIDGGIGGANLKVGLPGIYWANFFGPQYVHWIGEYKFESLTVNHKEHLQDGGWLIIARNDPSLYGTRKIIREETKIMKQLRRDAFFEMRNSKKKISVPDLWND
jgi:hypothetical protein